VRRFCGAAALAWLYWPEISAQGVRERPASQEIRALVLDTIVTHTMPGMVAGIADANGLIAVGAAGFRKAGDATAITEDDSVHIGSCTKAMTSAVLAALVEDGTLRWDSKLVEVVPELKGEIHGAYETVTLWDLVTHRGRVPANARSWWAHADLDLKARRLALVKDGLKDEPTVIAGEFEYSNLGYVAAASMAEAATGETWESLIRARVFEPLGMTTAGFGPPGASGNVDQPWGHARREGGWASSQQDNPEALGPAGRVHCSMADWAKFAALQLGKDGTAILGRETLDKLIEPTGDYAAGWIVVRRDWAQGTALAHSGSNTMWYSTVWIAPELDRAYLVATNSCDEDSATICDEVIGKLIAIDRDQASGL
jgi:CubicO group peptidase (beta-lactamase class C family)